MKKNIFFYINWIIVALLIFFIGAYLGNGGFFTGIFGGGQITNSYLYNDVLSLLHSEYFNKNLNNNNLLYASIKGMVSSLNDPATIFLSPQDQTSYQNFSSGNTFAGIGIEIGYDNGNIIVTRIISGSPAASSSLGVGDQIIAVNKTNVNGQTIDQVVNEIRGNAGTNVDITEKKKGNSNNTDVNITREPIHIAAMNIEAQTSSSGKKIDDLIIDRFTEDNVADWKSEWDASVNQILSDKPDGLVIDLRDNPGGFLDGAVYALSDFLPKNSLGVIEQQRNMQDTRLYTQTDPRLKNIKIYVLVNANTASAAEIFSGALQYYKRAVIIGAPTYGKGTAQEVFNFPDGSSLHVTNVHWLLPSGRWINKSSPIKPDMKVDLTNTDFLNGNDPQLNAALGKF